MSRNWTEEQKKVISLRDRNILVSAAAGSGKTAVLVERILRKLTDPVNPVDIDRMLVMTFTRAAAGEMKERISAALDNAILQDPDNETLQRQSSLIHTAQITTIDGFCAWLIRNYFHMIGLDPGYRVADEGELKLLKEDVLNEILEEGYAGEDRGFLEFVECYASGKSDDVLKDYILQVYNAAMSYPYPEEWLRESLHYYSAETPEELRKTKTMELLWKTAAEETEEIERLAGEARKLCLEPSGPWAYEEAIADDCLLIRDLRDLISEKDYDGLHRYLNHLSFTKLSAKRMPDVDPYLKDTVKGLREEMKGALKDLGARLFPGTEAQILQTIKACRTPMQALVNLTNQFWLRFSEKKQERNLLDFTDMEHFALEILMERKEDGSYSMTDAARELSVKYEEVMVDEYQDSNLIQELLTACVSGWAKQKKNIFMVGDVKQSIYRFRLARPELFMEKYHSYQTEDASEQRIDLHKNFRSRREVLDSVNYIFRQIMGEELGGVEYDDAAALYPGAVFPEGGNPEFLSTEVLLLEKDGEELEEEQGNLNAIELEALAVAQKIRSMVGKEQIADSESGVYRPVEYGDIVVLLRSASGWAESFAQVFESAGIPAYTASRTGYFSALEVVTVLNYLRVCDNPLQDIPLTGVLRSPMAGLSTQELALLRSTCSEGYLYESILAFLNGQTDGADREVTGLKNKLHCFLEQLEKFRIRSEYTPIHELILQVLEETGYGKYARALPGGEQRSANLHMLAEKAMDYEKTSYRGLFNFIRYIEKLQKYEVDFGEVNLTDLNSGAVQIMTIHKSKGLEFPVVFVSGMGKQFNFQDINARLLIHPELGIGTDAILPEKRMLVSTMHKQMMRRAILKENLGEELRILYVALTRAKEKLILTGTVGETEKLVHTLAGYRDQEEWKLSLGSRMKAKTYWDFLLPALARHRCMDELYHVFGISVYRQRDLYDASAEFRVQMVTARELTGNEILEQTDRAMRKQRLKEWDADVIYEEEIRAELKRRFEYQYPYAYLKELPVKVSVSELKKRSYVSQEEREEGLYTERDLIPLIPHFVSKEENACTGSARGTAYHRVMECLDYDSVENEEALSLQIEQMKAEGKLQKEEAESIFISDILDFLASPIGKRMAHAARNQKLFREQPFVISEKASLLDLRWDGEETILVQGIIDAYFEEEGELVLVDYKTDRVQPGDEKRLVDLYHVQLEDYARALERMLSVKVKEAYIYSFTLGEEIRVLGK